jgi:hypothetical protein
MCIHRGDDVPVFTDGAEVLRGLEVLKEHYGVETEEDVFVRARAEFVNATSSDLGKGDHKAYVRGGLPSLSLYVKFALDKHAKLKSN